MKTERPSETAALVAQGTLLEKHNPLLAPLIDDEIPKLLEQTLIHHANGSDRYLRSIDSLWRRRLQRLRQRITIPGLSAHYVIRKHVIEKQVLSVLGAEVRQVVIVGAGYDMLGWKLANRSDDLMVFELDHPSTQQRKVSALTELQLHRNNLRFQATDLATIGIENVLEEMEGFDAESARIVVVEGVLMYLDEARVQEFLRGLSDSSSPPTDLLFTFMTMSEQGKPTFTPSSFLVDLWLRMKGEPFQWGIGTDELSSFLEISGFRLNTIISPKEMRKACGIPTGLYTLDGEYLAVAHSIRS